MKKNIMSNDELKAGLTRRLQSMDDGKADILECKAYFTGAGKLISATKLDMDGAEQVHRGIVLPKSTSDFLNLNQTQD